MLLIAKLTYVFPRSSSDTATIEDTSLASSASPSSAQPVERELQAAVAQIPASASSLLAAAQESAPAQAALKATQDESARAAAETVLAMAAQPAQDSEVADAAKAPAEEAGTQLEALPVLEAKEIEEATLAGAANCPLQRALLCFILAEPLTSTFEPHISMGPLHVWCQSRSEHVNSHGEGSHEDIPMGILMGPQ